MNRQETVADILAEKRLRAAEMEKTLGDQHSFVESLKSDADRLEAALKRESGDFAKIREALSDACYAMFNFLRAQNGGCEEMANALDKAKAALAAPPRNCDRFDSYPQAYDEWFKTEVLPRVYGVVGGVEPTFGGWLFLQVTEQKGGTND